jgi:ubiquitin-conjugating enzyme E2 I
LSILKLEEGWRPGITIKQVLTGIQDLLNNPNPASPANSEAASNFSRNKALYKQKLKAQAAKFLPDV